MRVWTALCVCHARLTARVAVARQVRRLKHFAITNLIADAFIVVGLLAILGYAIKSRATASTAPVIKAYNSHSYPLFLGTSVYVVRQLWCFYGGGPPPFTRVLTHTHLQVLL